jgi:hypothetical protein
LFVADAGLDLSVLDRMRVAYDGHEYRLTDFDLHNLRLLGELFSAPENGVAVFSPVPAGLLVLTCVMLPAMVLKRSLKVRSQSTYKDLRKGDLVKLRGLVGRYGGVGEDGLISVWFAKGLRYGMPLEMAWKLTRYNGRVKALSRFDRRAKRDGSREVAVLQDILGLEEDELPPFFTSRLVVVADKRETYEHLMRVTVNGCPWSSVFPAAYHTKVDKRTSFGMDPLRRNPIILFTSRLDTALELNRSDKADVIAVMDSKRLVGYYLDLEKEMSGGTAVAIIGDSKRWARREIEQLRTSGFRVSVWSSGNARPLAIRRSDTSAETVLHRSSRVLRNLAWAKWSFLEVAPGGCANLNTCWKLVFDLARHSHSEDSDQFISEARQLLLSLACLPIPRAHCRQLHVRDEGLLERLRSTGIRARTTVSDKTSTLIERIICSAEEALGSCYDSHPKEERFLERAALLTDGGCVIARTGEDQHCLSEWLNAHDLRTRVCRITEVFRRSIPGDTALLPGWWGGSQSRLEYSGLFAGHEIVAFQYEREWQGRQSENETRFLRDPSSSSTKPGVVMDAGHPDDLDEIIERVSSRVYHTAITTMGALAETEGVAQAIPVRFGSDFCAFLTPTHRCRCIDFDADRIVVKTPAELEPGDVLVFVKDSADDIFDRLVAAAREASPAMAETVRLAGLWKSALRESVAGGTPDVRTVQARLRAVGVKRSAAAIRRWLTDEDAIGPEDDALHAIAEFTGHAELRSRLEDVLFACRRLRALHVRLGRYLAAAIVSSVVGDDPDAEESLLASIVHDLSEHAEAVTVLSVAREAVEVPVSKVNRLLDIST